MASLGLHAGTSLLPLWPQWLSLTTEKDSIVPLLWYSLTLVPEPYGQSCQVQLLTWDRDREPVVTASA